MPQKVLKFTGINRKVNEFQNSGACEELVNLRPDNSGGYSVVRPKMVSVPDVEYAAIYMHSWGDTSIRVAVEEDGSVSWTNLKDNSGGYVTTESMGESVSISSAGNVLMLYGKDDENQLVFKFVDGKYERYNVSIRPIKEAWVRYVYNVNNPASNLVGEVDFSVEGYNEAMNKAASGFYSKYKNGLCGAAVIGCTYELEDGTEMWSTAFVTANITRYPGYVKPGFDTNSKGFKVTGASKVYFQLSLDGEKAEGVKRINVYATRPVFPYEAELVDSDSVTITERSLYDANLGGQLMYYQGSVAADQDMAYLLLDFGMEQAGERVMKVDAGCIERTGNTVSYNNRFHYYGSKKMHILQNPTVSDNGDGTVDGSNWIAYVEFNGEWKLVDRVYYFSDKATNDFIYPMAGVKRLAFVKGEWVSGDFETDYSEMFYVEMRDSSAYNYSLAFGVTPSIVSGTEFYNSIKNSGKLWGDGFDTKVLMEKESNAINVSAPYNPFVFPVEYSYSFGGEILDIATSYLPISSTQIGQYPLTVFTSNGIYALEQGSGSVLYGNIVPLQPMVIDGKAVSTPSGIFFISSRSVFVLSGRDAANVSHILNGSIEESVKSTDAFQVLCCSGRRGLFNFQQHLCDEEFEDFVQGATMAYDQLNNELIISNPDEAIMYSYVFNLDTRSYHKIPRKYAGVQNGARYAIEVSTGGRNIVDMHIENEAKQPILLQSRPLPLDAFFTHIQRLVFLADASLDGGDNLCLSVFASDNLNDWKCVISAQKHDATFRQIRTNRAARSHRDYVILINGTVSTRTDISDIIADYTIVQRRLG